MIDTLAVIRRMSQTRLWRAGEYASNGRVFVDYATGERLVRWHTEREVRLPRR